MCILGEAISTEEEQMFNQTWEDCMGYRVALSTWKRDNKYPWQIASSCDPPLGLFPVSLRKGGHILCFGIGKEGTFLERRVSTVSFPP